MEKLKPAPKPFAPGELTALANAVIAADRFPKLATVDRGRPRVRPVSPVRTDGFGLGLVNTRPRRHCETGGGYVAIWAVRKGAWKEVIGTQEVVQCHRLERFDIPAEIGVDECYRGGEVVPYDHP